ncbi:MAG: hypothetical protein J6S95_06975 [Lachnospiraceae bacterium]|nr:hypothetical protein [Lachnospiraceae bacterium]
MLNEERIKLMTRMASYEDNEGRKNVAVSRHFRSDYVSLQVIKAIICATIAYMIVCGAYIYYDFEEFMSNIYKIDLLDLAAKMLKYYVIFTVAYCVLVYIAFSVKYGKAKKNLKRYFNNLKLLGAMYNKEDEEGNNFQ